MLGERRGGESSSRPKSLVIPIIVNWNTTALTAEALTSLRKQRYPRLQSVVVDNGSSDQVEALRSIEEAFPEVVTIASQENLGYAGGCNLGIGRALDLGAEFILLLNSDISLHPDAIAELVAALETDRSAGAAGPLILYASPPDRIWFAGGSLLMGPRVLQRHDHQDEQYGPHLDGPPRESEWLCGAALLARRGALEKAGPMDSIYFHYWEDVDWCYRLRRSGFRLLFVPQARVWHKVGASLPALGGQVYYWERNRLLFTERWGTWVARLSAWTKVFWRLGTWRIRGLARDDTARAKLEAYRDYLRRRFGPRGDDA
jgi:GT2 family glycosyltransferase